MNNRTHRARRLKSASRLMAGLACLLFAMPPAGAQQQQEAEGVGPFRIQTIQLVAGWNAVYLEIEPDKGDPSALFAGTPIEIAASYFRPVTAMEFIENPSEILPDRKGWNVWYAPQRDDALLSNLSAIHAHRAYLLYSGRAYTWSLRGTPFHGSATWHPNAFSLVGFPIDPAEQPTIAGFFSGTGAHSPLTIYQMVGGRWSLITDPARVPLKPGAAYWTYSKGASNFRGPLTVEFSGSASGGLVFDEATTTRTLEIRNVSPFPQNLTFTLLGGQTGVLPLSYVARMLDQPDRPVAAVSIPLTQGMKLGPLEAGAAFVLELEVAQEAVSVPLMSTTLTISSNAGPRIEIPLISTRADLLANP
jgi:hypothetical protein